MGIPEDYGEVAKTPVCYFGSKWGLHGCGPCAKCRRHANEMEASFWRGVFFGEHDQRGYTPTERKSGRRTLGR